MAVVHEAAQRISTASKGAIRMQEPVVKQGWGAGAKGGQPPRWVWPRPIRPRPTINEPTINSLCILE